MNKSFVAKLFSLLLIFGLTACQTGYRAKSVIDGLGYQDEALGEGI
ncbi:hypothetical protein [Agaribacter flavus]|uniref:Lipoprotein n=1 Tax=Agaribacter flavus TaxID=1902781 RepID=A0ABV7FPK2_9ALTE